MLTHFSVSGLIMLTNFSVLGLIMLTHFMHFTTRYADSFQGLRTHYADSFQGLKTHYADSFQGLRTYYDDSFQGLRTHYADSFQGLRTYYADSFQGLRTHYADSFQGLRTHYADSFQAFLQPGRSVDSWVREAFTDLLDVFFAGNSDTINCERRRRCEAETAAGGGPSPVGRQLHFDGQVLSDPLVLLPLVLEVSLRLLQFGKSFRVSGSEVQLLQIHTWTGNRKCVYPHLPASYCLALIMVSSMVLFTSVFMSETHVQRWCFDAEISEGVPQCLLGNGELSELIGQRLGELGHVIVALPVVLQKLQPRLQIQIHGPRTTTQQHQFLEQELRGQRSEIKAPWQPEDRLGNREISRRPIGSQIKRL
ncbi:hypothetical protein F7725_004983 [Dissostichus mawsoni]|uniref:Uncharacterized protein n=1 Tax=Dissostichus mawsoni TaxID=36200 RepID=A0A7J5XLU5_DISMA|nr:hypothetical protein F7725_004983 [Dissostichus mawsoni]